MKIGVLGTGMVGEAIATKLVQAGHEVRMGSRTKANETAVAWAKRNGAKASAGTFADAAGFGEVVFNCTKGEYSLEAVRAAGESTLANKVLVDVANPLDFSRGMPPSLLISNTDSLGEQIQRALPSTRVVKALNTVNAYIMVSPSNLPGEHNLFLCGNDTAAKRQVHGILTESFGWKSESIVDLGDITGARATEQYLPLWVRLYGTLGNPNFNVRVVIGPPPKLG
ncbi:MAG: NAD(P)-binding domain-containing protein [Deltaproteobacteria bacterium]|nr:NAD(P)-binding domain-containing protein [Deltaproteobacteria bacterium]